jgi:hypothetical protein
MTSDPFAMSALRPSAPVDRALPTSAEWCAYYAANASAATTIPWGCGARLTEAERRAVAASVQEFQLGERSEGQHLHAAARAYAGSTGDDAYVRAIEAFIREEQRHARYLGRFLAMEGIPLRRRSWPDDVFRFLRRGAGLETTVAVLLTAEVIAQVYYAALRGATRSPVLRALCERILRDEAAHVRFQAERLALLRAGRGRFAVRIACAGQRALFAGAAVVVWNGHRAVLRRGGFPFRRYWRQCWRQFARAAVMMDPAGSAPRSRAPVSASGTARLRARSSAAGALADGRAAGPAPGAPPCPASTRIPL